jgi:hypothetical protein
MQLQGANPMNRYVFTERPGFWSVMDTLEKRAVCQCATMADAERIVTLLNGECDLLAACVNVVTATRMDAWAREELKAAIAKAQEPTP